MAERRTTEAALQRSRKEHRDIVHYASVGVYQTDPDGKILLANPALARILGYDQPAELIGRNLSDMYWDRAERAALVAQFEPLGGEEFEIEVQWKRSDGSPIWVDLHARSVREAEGRTAYYEGFVYDLTGRKDLERQFLQAQKMEADRPARRRSGARLQQSAHGHPQLRASCSPTAIGTTGESRADVEQIADGGASARPS